MSNGPRPVRLLLAGATGLVGGALLRQAIVDPRVGLVVAPTRRPLPPADKLENPIVDFERLPADAAWWIVDAAISTLGTTIKKAGSKDAFRRVDHDYVRDVARLARAHGARAFALTSATGADATSRIFYNRVKGETERSLDGCGYPSLTIVRPGVIGGERAESRPVEYAAIQLLRVLGPLLPRQLRLSPAAHVAHALLEAAIAAAPGRHLVTAAELA
ncbi:MAG: NAD-dependent dehydratase [Vicinamibacterales bacterium]